jgi:hypothetical protein
MSADFVVVVEIFLSYKENLRIVIVKETATTSTFLPVHPMYPTADVTDKPLRTYLPS